MGRRRTTAYYVLTPSGYLLEYKDPNPITNPDPVLSLKLSDSEIGHSPSRSGSPGFTIRGKDAGKSFGGMSHEYIFRTDSMEQAEQWWSKLEKLVGGAPRADTGGALTESEDEGETAAVAGGRKVRAEPGQVAGQHVPVQTAVPTETGTRGQTAAAHAVTEPAVVPGGTNVQTVPVTTAAPTAMAGVQPTATTGVAAPTATATHPRTTTSA